MISSNSAPPSKLEMMYSQAPSSVKGQPLLGSVIDVGVQWLGMFATKSVRRVRLDLASTARRRRIEAHTTTVSSPGRPIHNGII